MSRSTDSESEIDSTLAVSEHIRMTPLGSTSDLVNKGDYEVELNAGDASAIDNQDRAQALPPVDGGKAAWLFLASCYLLELMCFGPAFSWSVFQDYLQRSEHSPLKNESTVTISAIGTLLFSMLYFAPALARPFFWLHPTYARLVMRVCLAVAIVALVGASFATNASILVGVVGFVVGLACGIMTTPYLLWLPQWFVKRRGFAMGVAFSGAGLGGLLFPFIFSASLENLGLAWTLRIWALCLLIGAGPALIGIRPRLPITARVTSKIRHRRADYVKVVKKQFGYLLSTLWLFNALLTLTASAGYFAISFYLGTYCSSLGLSSAASTGAVSAFNAASLLGEVTIGYLCDRFSYTGIMLGIGITGTLASLLLFGLAKNLAMVLLFTLIFGWAAGSFCATWPASATDIARLRNMQSADVMISYTIMRGIAAIVGPLVAAKLYRPDLKADAAVFGSFGFAPLTIFVGICMSLVAGLAVLTEVSRRMSFKGVDVKLLGERL